MSFQTKLQETERKFVQHVDRAASVELENAKLSRDNEVLVFLFSVVSQPVIYNYYCVFLLYMRNAFVSAH